MEIQINEKEYIRLPNTVKPSKYMIDIYLDILNLNYEIKEQISLIFNQENTKYFCIHALPEYQISKIEISNSYDLISEKYNFQNCSFVYSGTLVSIIKILRSKFKEIFSKVKGQRQENNKLTSSNYKENNSFLEQFNEIWNEFYQKSADFLMRFCIDNFFIQIETEDLFSDINILEETIYIIPPLDIIRNSEVILKIEVKGSVRTKMEGNGFYFSFFGENAKLLYDQKNFLLKWRDPIQGKDLRSKAIFGVVCEPVEFRSIFPCFDEPSFKAKFLVNISIDTKYLENKLQILSNGELMKIVSDEKTNLTTYYFSESPLMSIYLLTWVIGNLEYLETTTLSKILIRVFTPQDSISDGIFALDVAHRALEFYENYFEIPYTFPKLDLIPLGTMKFRALENWGAITFINYALLCPQSLEISERKNNARTICHEISHMWFGNLVTMDWWDDIWLNEGFARYMEFLCLEKTKPDFEIWLTYIEKILLTAFEVDEESNTHPVHCLVPSPRMLQDIFDTISYAKGSSIIRMLSYIVGPEIFKECISKYLKKYSFRNTKTHDLWSVFDEVTGKKISELMESWINNIGHPCIEVSIKDNNFIHIKQKPFPKNFSTELTLLWKIPLFIKTNNTEFTVIMNDENLEIDMKKDLGINYDDILSGKTAVKFNSEMKGFYRVYYDTVLFNNLLYNQNSLTDIDNLGVITDYLAKGLYFEVLTYLKASQPINNRLLLKIAFNFFTTLKEILFQLPVFYDENDKFNMNNDKYLDKTIYEYNLLMIKIKHFFGNLTNVSKEAIKNAVFILCDNYTIYNENNDETYELALTYYTIIEEDINLAKFIIENFEKHFHKINSNLRYIVYTIVIRYSSNIYPDNIELQSRMYHLISNEFYKNYFDLTLLAKGNFKAALFNLSKLNEKDFDDFANRIIFDRNFKEIYFKRVNFFRNFPHNRKVFIDFYMKLLSRNVDKFYNRDLHCFNQSIHQNEFLNNFIINYETFISDMYCENTIRKVTQLILTSIKDEVSEECIEELEEILTKCINYINLAKKKERADKVIIEVFKFFNNY